MNQGFFSTLFDLTFSEFITIRILKVLYVVGIVLIGLTGLSILVSGFAQGFGTGLVALVITPPVALLSIIILRILLELIVVAFQIFEDIHRLAYKDKPPSLTMAE